MEKARITVDGLLSLWARMPNSDCQVWDGDMLLLSTKNPNPNQTVGEINRIGSMEVRGFWCAHDDNNTLVIRVD